MVAEHPPFTYARPDDSYYKCITSNRSDLYWKLVSKGRDKLPPYSDDFKDLITSCLQLEANHRPTMSELMNHPWVVKDIPSHNDLAYEIKQRKN